MVSPSVLFPQALTLKSNSIRRPTFIFKTLTKMLPNRNSMNYSKLKALSCHANLRHTLIKREAEDMLSSNSRAKRILRRHSKNWKDTILKERLLKSIDTQRKRSLLKRESLSLLNHPIIFSSNISHKALMIVNLPYCSLLLVPSNPQRSRETNRVLQRITALYASRTKKMLRKLSMRWI